MGSFSIWHWLILLVLLATPVAIGLLVWLIVRISNKRAAAKRIASPSDGVG